MAERPKFDPDQNTDAPLSESRFAEYAREQAGRLFDDFPKGPSGELLVHVDPYGLAIDTEGEEVPDESE